MAYIALYRKMRPKGFSEVVGQDHIVKTLVNQIEGGRINHAYLFCGTRGTGKTSTAKIFAKVINCEAQSVETRPCNECEMCQAVNEGRSMNVVEIDAASNNGVDNIREIREEVKYPPAQGKYKIYIIDEVHMLSIGAFNALLKTLEEPPEHVVFILATTDPQKLPATVLSRCQRFDFRRISTADMVEALAEYMKKEGVDIEKEALNYIARVSDGAMRDALSILEQCVSFNFNETITLDKVLDIVGSVDNSLFFCMTQAIFDNNSADCISIIDELMLKGRDINQFALDLVYHFRNLLVAKAVSEGEASVLLDMSAENAGQLKRQADNLSRAYLTKLVEDFSDTQGQMKYSSNPRVIFEVACLRSCNPVLSKDESALEMRLKALEKKIERLEARGISIPAAMPQTVQKKEEEEKLPPLQKAVPADIKDIIEKWTQIKFGIPFMRTLCLNQVQAVYLEDEFLTLACDNEAAKIYLDKNIDELKKILASNFGKEIPVMLMLREHYEIRHKELYGRGDPELKQKVSYKDINNLLNFEDIEITNSDEGNLEDDPNHY